MLLGNLNILRSVLILLLKEERVTWCLGGDCSRYLCVCGLRTPKKAFMKAYCSSVSLRKLKKAFMKVYCSSVSLRKPKQAFMKVYCSSVSLRKPNKAFMNNESVLFVRLFFSPTNCWIHTHTHNLQALVYNILPSTTAVFSYAIGSRNCQLTSSFLLVLRQ